MSKRINNEYAICNNSKCQECSQHTVDYCGTIPEEANMILQYLRQAERYCENMESSEIYMDVFQQCMKPNFDLSVLLYNLRKSCNIKIGIICELQLMHNTFNEGK